MKLLLHDCCAPCGAYVVNELLDKGYDVTVYFYNSNIIPEEEYELRLQEMQRFCAEKKVPLIVAKYNHEDWLTSVAGFEKEPEGGARCEKCFMHRLGEVAQKAMEDGFEIFATTLTVSPHKPVEMINKIGHEFADFYNIKFLDTIWRENDGYKKACQLSKEYGFHRQNYCGCEFSVNTN
jgi:predicted adenine nucleotide alpha hydrolase (AANH) superfamily ATPase